MILTVVIPTYNRADTLKRAIEGYMAQTARASIHEILVVDDGSTDGTKAVIAEVAQESAMTIRYYRQENKGPAAARNVGIREAQGEIILFTDDDIIPTPTLVAEHLAWHRRFPSASDAVLGYVTWAPEVDATPFMDWYGSFLLFEYGRLQGRAVVEGRYFYSCNVSVKTSFLREFGTFDEEFKVAAYEDIELGYRLEKSGMRLFYNQNALAHHFQYISFNSACRRSKKAAAAFKIFTRKEAGRYYYRTPGLRQFLTNRLAQYGGPILRPVSGWMDGSLPMPAGVYRLIFRICRS